MKIIHVPWTMYPDSVGGTEIYVTSLARCLRDRGHTPIIVAAGTRDASYTHDGITVHRLAAPEWNNRGSSPGHDTAGAAARFAALVDRERPDVVHLHTVTPAIPLEAVHEMRRREIPVILTYHTAPISCQRGTLMLFGAEPCDGLIETRRCATCMAQSKGLPRSLARAVAGVPLDSRLAGLPLPGRVSTALRMRELSQEFRDGFHALAREVSQIVALCQWTANVLLLNGVPAERITLSRHGIDLPRTAPPPRTPSDCTTRIAFAGRLNRAKGLHLLLEALRSLPTVDLRLDIYGEAHDAPSGEYATRLQQSVAHDSRIRFLPPLPNGRVIPTLAGYDLVAVPSQVLETGPLVVLEAFAAGVPIIGSRLGGVAELVRHEIDGLLVEPFSVSAWTASLRRIVDEPGLRARLRGAVRPPRSISAVTEDMLQLYRRVIDGERTDGIVMDEGLIRK